MARGLQAGTCMPVGNYFNAGGPSESRDFRFHCVDGSAGSPKMRSTKSASHSSSVPNMLKHGAHRCCGMHVHPRWDSISEHAEYSVHGKHEAAEQAELSTPWPT